MGVILPLETSLVESTRLLHFAYRILADELGEEPPTLAAAREVIGSSVRDATVTFGWPIEGKDQPKVENKLFFIVSSLIDKMPITSRANAAELINELLIDNNQIVLTIAELVSSQYCKSHHHYHQIVRLSYFFVCI